MTLRVFTFRTAVVYGLLLGVIIMSLMAFFYSDSSRAANEEILLLISDQIPKDDARVTVWKDAAREEGIPLKVMQDSEFLRPWTARSAYAGIILPDHVHTTISEVLFHELRDYVTQGGKLMLVYDAGTKAPNNTYFPGKSIFSDLVGIDYSLYDRLRDKTIGSGALMGARSTMDQLRIPPGKYAVSSEVLNPHPLASDLKHAAGPLQTLTGYQYEKFSYPSFVTGHAYSGKPLLVSPATGLIAGYRPVGAGGALFVNLPLGYLKGRTDGILLHGFLGYFAEAVVAMPMLATVPNGVGGLIMNWHVDSNAAPKAIYEIETLGIYNQGPFSIHITAGPDTREFNDGLGLDVSNNESFQKWIRSEVKRGNVIGSHGGWIHDYFGTNVDKDNRQEFEKYLEMNKQVLEQASGMPMLEYSAPLGNQPEWVTTWLEEKGFLAYYFTGNTGMGPTRSYRNGRLNHHRIWSFPILTFNEAASFEEMKASKYSPEVVSEWLAAVTEFSVRRRTARLIYFHPPGMMVYPRVMRTWLTHTADIMQRQQPFRWYTMVDLSKFLNEREKTSWSVARNQRKRIITASHPNDLSRQTWFLPKSAYRRPVITKGNGQILEDQQRWLVVAQSGKTLTFESEKVHP